MQPFTTPDEVLGNLSETNSPLTGVTIETVLPVPNDTPVPQSSASAPSLLLSTLAKTIRNVFHPDKNDGSSGETKTEKPAKQSQDHSAASRLAHR
jgi:hypothetical protein